MGLISVLATTGSWLAPLTVASLPALASIAAALLSARSARASRSAELEASRVRDLEERLADRKYTVYQPMIDILRQIMESKGNTDSKLQGTLKGKLSEFAAWVTIFGSDEAVRAFHNFMQGAYHDAPPRILLRLYADFLIAARRDMGDTTSSVSAIHVLGMRITDLYDDDSFLRAATLPFSHLATEEGWKIPWPLAAAER